MKTCTPKTGSVISNLDRKNKMNLKLAAKVALSAAAMLLFLITVSACGNTVKAKEYGDEWPLTVNKATVHCWTDWGQSADPLLTLSVGDYYYPLTGYTASYLRANTRILLKDVSTIQIVGKNIHPLRERAKEVC